MLTRCAAYLVAMNGAPRREGSICHQEPEQADNSIWFRSSPPDRWTPSRACGRAGARAREGRITTYPFRAVSSTLAAFYYLGRVITLAKVQVSLTDRLAALDAVRAIHDSDSRLWEQAIDDAFGRFGGVESLVHALADLVLDEVAPECRGDAYEVRRHLLTRRDMVQIEQAAVASGQVS